MWLFCFLNASAISDTNFTYGLKSLPKLYKWKAILCSTCTIFNSRANPSDDSFSACYIKRMLNKLCNICNLIELNLHFWFDLKLVGTWTVAPKQQIIYIHHFVQLCEESSQTFVAFVPLVNVNMVEMYIFYQFQ